MWRSWVCCGRNCKANEAGLRTLRAFWKLLSTMTGTADDEEGGKDGGAVGAQKGGPAQCDTYGLSVYRFLCLTPNEGCTSVKNSSADLSRCAQRDMAKCGRHDVLEFRYVKRHTAARQQEEMFELEKSLPRGSEGADRRAKSEGDLEVRSFRRRYYGRFEGL